MRQAAPLVLSLAFALTLVGCASEPEPAETPRPAASETREPAATSTPTPTPTPPPAPTTGALGTELSSENWRINVLAVSTVPGSEQAQRIAPPGTQCVALDINTCAIPTSLDFPHMDMAVVGADGRSYTYWNVQIGAVDPNLTDTDNAIPAGACTRGWLTMIVDAATAPASITFTDVDSEERLTWTTS